MQIKKATQTSASEVIAFPQPTIAHTSDEEAMGALLGKAQEEGGFLIFQPILDAPATTRSDANFDVLGRSGVEKYIGVATGYETDESKARMIRYKGQLYVMQPPAEKKEEGAKGENKGEGDETEEE